MVAVHTSPDERLSPTPSSAKATGSQFEAWILFALSCLLYAVTTGNDFVVDDRFLVGSPYVKSFHYLGQIFGHSFWTLVGQSGNDSFYRPLVVVSILVEHSLFGVHAGWYHLINVFLNAAVVVQVYRLAKYWWPRGRTALFAGLLFAVLPVHTENVAPVSGISDLGCALFMLLCARVYVQEADSDTSRRTRTWAAAGLLLVAALYKEVALVVPVLLGFYELAGKPFMPQKFKSILARYVPLLFAAVLYIAARFEAMQGLTQVPHHTDLGLGKTVLSGFNLVGMYAYKLVWPQHLSYYLTFAPPRNWHDLYMLLGILVSLLGAINFFRYWRRASSVSFAILWFFLALAPTLNVHWLGASPYGERYLYIPSAGACWLAGLGLAWLTDAQENTSLARRRLGYSVLTLILVLGAIRTALRLPEWKDNLVLAEATVREDPHVGIYLVFAGNVYMERGDRNKAREQYIKALARDPGCVQAYMDLAGVFMYDQKIPTARLFLQRAAQLRPLDAMIYYDWGVLELQQGASERARQLFEHTIALNPYYCEALNNLGAIALDEGKLGRAEEYLQRAVRADPRSVDVRLNLGAVYGGQNRPADAERELRLAINLAPRSTAPYLALARLYEQAGKKSEALAMYQAAVRVDPNSGVAQFRLGVLARKLGNLGQAARALERAAEIQPQSPLVHAELGFTYLAAGKTDDARQELETSLRLDPRNQPAREALQKIH
ncbi:MAG: tetratricopeptide repeat protein [Acidobacteriia bacterium]|nr:tetratricopeptide repeat protein [Terriglobia bacterium]